MGRGVIAVIALAAFALAGVATADTVQQAGLRVGFEASIAPKELPREGSTPVAVSFAIRVGTVDGAPPPQLQRIQVAINRNGRLDPTGLGTCSYGRLQATDTSAALSACREALVGEGRFSARVLIPDQAPFPSRGKVFVYYGRYRGHAALLAHVYGNKPAPNAYTVPFVLSRSRGTFGTVLTAELGDVAGGAGYITSLQLTIRHFRAACPAGAGFESTLYPVARAELRFAGGRRLGGRLLRGCSVSD